MKRALSFLLAMIFVVAPLVSAQVTPPRVAPAAKSSNRVALEQQVRERTAQVLKTRLGISDAQMAQLEQSNRRFAPQLAQLQSQERDTRRQLRQEMQSASPNQQRVSDLLDASLRFQRQRLDLVESEQKDLAGFLTPVQRAGYLAFQIQLRKRAEELAGQNGGRAGGLRRRQIPRVP